MTVWAPTYGEMERLIVANLHRIRGLGAGVIVHLPRSGTAPAGMIATYLPAPLASVDEYCAGMISDRKCPPFDRNNVILVDDCINKGKQAAAAIERIRKANQGAKVTLVAIYDCARQGSSRKFPFNFISFAAHDAGDDGDYLYPYYVWKSHRLRHVAVDFDGVLCRDARKKEDDDGPNYLRFLREVEPKFLPLNQIETRVTDRRGKRTIEKVDPVIGAIVTARCEKYRAETEDWLARNGVQFDTLHMGPWSGKADRAGGGKAAKWKAEVYAGMGPEIRLFIESSETQSAEIHAITGKPVFSVETMVLHQ